MKNIHAIVAITSAMILLTTTGCQLAKADDQVGPANAWATTEQIGAIIVADDLDDLFDTNFDPLNPNINPQIVGKASQSDWYFVFPGVDGVQMFSVDGSKYPSFGEVGIVNSFWPQDAVGDGSSDTSYNGDNNRTTMLSGTVYVSETTKEVTMYPIYQSEEGEVYITSPGSSWEINTDAGTDQGTMSWTGTSAISVGDQSITNAMTVSVDIKLATVPTSITIAEMTSDNWMARQTNYTAGKFPKSLTVPAGVAYLVLEQHQTVPGGKTHTTRSIYNRGDANMTIPCEAFQKNFCVQRDVALTWQ